MPKIQVIVIGASASGLMCAIEAAKRGRHVLVLDHANKAGKKILMSGGGRCNFTNYHVSAENYLSQNPHFCKSALSRYTQWDFISLVEQHGIAYHERGHGQLFCNDSAKNIRDMLLVECQRAGVVVKLNADIISIRKSSDSLFVVKTINENVNCESIVIASGGLSIPKMCASPFGYRIAEQFSINVVPTYAGLVPFTLQPEDKRRFSLLSGIAIDSLVSFRDQAFRENILFTHRGLSGPAILQISSFWESGNAVCIDLLPDLDLEAELNAMCESHPQKQVNTFLGQYLPKRLINVFLPEALLQSPLKRLSKKQIILLSDTFQRWTIMPNGTEGYRTAEVTIGGVDCNEVSSKTMESQKVNGLYFIGEVLDVSGWLGGYNFQWAWSSGWCAGQYA